MTKSEKRMVIQLELETLVWKVLNNERRDWDGCLDQYAKWIGETTQAILNKS